MHIFISDEDYKKARENDISKPTLDARIRKLGWSKHDAIHTRLNKKWSQYGDWPEKAEENGISKQLFRSRIEKLGWSKEKAATEPVQNGDMARKAERNGISYKTYYKRVYNGWNKEQAAWIPVKKKGKKKHIFI